MEPPAQQRQQRSTQQQRQQRPAPSQQLQQRQRLSPLKPQYRRSTEQKPLSGLGFGGSSSSTASSSVRPLMAEPMDTSAPVPLPPSSAAPLPSSSVSSRSTPSRFSSRLAPRPRSTNVDVRVVDGQFSVVRDNGADDVLEISVAGGETVEEVAPLSSEEEF